MPCTAERPHPSVMASPVHPRVIIRFCTQCKWMLRAAYFAQELLSTFSTDLGEVALVPSTGGVFVIEIDTGSPTAGDTGVPGRVLWDRKIDNGFPATKELKKRVRDVIDPGRDLGHVDGKKQTKEETPVLTPDEMPARQSIWKGEVCEDFGEVQRILRPLKYNLPEYFYSSISSRRSTVPWQEDYFCTLPLG